MSKISEDLDVLSSEEFGTVLPRLVLLISEKP